MANPATIHHPSHGLPKQAVKYGSDVDRPARAWRYVRSTEYVHTYIHLDVSHNVIPLRRRDLWLIYQDLHIFTQDSYLPTYLGT